MNILRSELVELMVELGVDTARGLSAATLGERVNRSGGIARYDDPPGSFAGQHLALFDRIAAAQASGEKVEVTEDEEVAATEPPPKKAKTATKAKSGAGKKAKAKVNPNGTAAPPKAKAGVKAKAKVREVRTHAAKASQSAVATAAPPKTKAKKDRKPQLGDIPYQKWKAFYAANPMRLTGRGPGIMTAVLSELKEAGKGYSPKGITKPELLAILTQKFPDRDPLKMETNLNNLVPGRFKIHYGIHVWKRKREDGKWVYYVKGDGSVPQVNPAS